MCLNGCPKVGLAVYDDQDYNQDGYHRVTRLDRGGLQRPRDALYIGSNDANAPDGEVIFPWPGQVVEDGAGEFDGIQPDTQMYLVPYLGLVKKPITTMIPLVLPDVVPELRNFQNLLPPPNPLAISPEYPALYAAIRGLHNSHHLPGYIADAFGMDAEGFGMDGFGTCKHSDGRSLNACTDIFNRHVRIRPPGTRPERP